MQLLCGMERKARTDPKAFARTPAEEDRADAATQALRYIADDNDFSLVRSAVFENMLIEGAGGAELGLEDDGQGGVQHHDHAHPVGPHLVRSAQPIAGLQRRPLQGPGHLDGPGRTRGDVSRRGRRCNREQLPRADFHYNDRPETAFWTDNNRRARAPRAMRLVRAWNLVARDVHQERAAGRAAAKSKFKDRKGKSACGLLLQSAYINRENQRYGMVRGLISLQDEINKRRCKALHLLSVRQVVAEQGAVPDVDKARREVARPDGYVEVMPGLRFEIEQTADLAAGQFQLLQHATAEMQLSGPNAAMSGTDPRELSAAGPSWRSRRAVQRRTSRWPTRCGSGRAASTKAAGWPRGSSGPAANGCSVTDDLNETRWVGINRPVRLMDKLADMPEQQRAMVMQQMQLQPGDPRLQQVVGIENDISDLDVDITIEEGIDIPSLQAEEFQSLVQLAGMQPGLIPGDVLIAARAARQRHDPRADEGTPAAAAQAQQQAGQLATQHAQADIQGKQAKAQADMALAQERKVNAAANVHRVHGEFSAPPYGQPHVAPDNPPGASQPMQQPLDPEQMDPRDGSDAPHGGSGQKAGRHSQYAGEHAADRRQDSASRTADAAHRAPDAQTAITTNRLMRTPIPQPQPPGSAP